MTLALLLLGACGPPENPRLEGIAAGIAAWEEGARKLEAGDAAGARAAFAKARERDPEQTTLALWEARAAAAGGDTTGAVAILDATLRDHPGTSLGWYNRAAYRARLGDLGGSAADLKVALSAGVATPWAATIDPDFAPHRGDPAFEGVLPPAPVRALLAGPAGAVFLGGTVEAVLTIEGLPTPPPLVRAVDPDVGCLVPKELVEDEHVADGVLQRLLRLRFETRAPCSTTVGPFVVVLEGVETRSEGVAVVVEAPPGTPGTGGGRLPEPLPIPGAFYDGTSPHVARRVGDGVIALAPPDVEVRLDRDGAPVARALSLELRVEGQTRVRGGWWPGGGGVVSAGDWKETVP